MCVAVWGICDELVKVTVGTVLVWDQMGTEGGRGGDMGPQRPPAAVTAPLG